MRGPKREPRCIPPSTRVADINNRADDLGGALLSQGGLQVVFYGSRLTDDSAFSGGGGLWAGETVLNLIRTEVIGNVATYEVSSTGGGICLCGDADVEITDSTIRRNMAANGGGIGGTGPANLSVLRSSLAANHAFHIGGAVWARDLVDFNFVDSTLEGNSVGEDGGAIALLESDLTLVQSTLSANSSERGYALFQALGPSTALLLSCPIAGHEAPAA